MLSQNKKDRANNISKSNGRFIDEVGNKYGKLLVLEYVGSGKVIKNGNDVGAMWKCQCECGNTYIARGTKLRRGKSKSCGCSLVLPKGEGSFNAMYSVRRESARRRGLEWNITKEFVKNVSLKNCAYCGKQPSNTSKGSSNGTFRYSVMDRVDSSIGYTESNIVPCCEDCNKAKMTKSVDDFLDWIRRIMSFNGWVKDPINIKFKDI
jgi:hypothetical protein